jgi:hypothetical protein|nr:D-Ala-D-Ala carboxypeptidase family metallohydrolase [uncultured Parabacteroides sp.]
MESRSKKTILSEHFTLEELTYSRTAVENGIANEPPPQIRTSLQHLADCLLEPLRQLYKKPIAVLSGYRNKEVNRLVGGVATSQHVKGEAADCYTPEGPEKLLELLMRSGLPFDQAILYKRRRFLHLSLKLSGRNRMQVLVYMVCVVCLFTGCGLKRDIHRLESNNRYDSIRFDGADSLLYQSRSILCDSQLWELKQTVYLPPDSAGRQALQSITVARLRQVRNQTDSLSSTTITQQSYSALATENNQKEETRHSTNIRLPILIIAGLCLLIGGVAVKSIRLLS